MQLNLPQPDKTLLPYRLSVPKWLPVASELRSRTVFGAAHVVCDPLAENRLGAPAVVDWESTLAFREHLWSHGLGIAEAMDTAQRGMGLDWKATSELIRRSCAVANGRPIVCGAGTDQLSPVREHTLKEIQTAYLEQCEVIEGAGGRIVLMASRALGAVAKGPDEYAALYDQVLSQISGKVILHWLGDMFDPALKGYWGSKDFGEAAESVLAIIGRRTDKIDGIKISLLDKDREIHLRRQLPKNVKLYTGDDFNYPELILGDDFGYSHALLGIFDGIAPAASAAISALDQGHRSDFLRILEPTVPLARHIFEAPTYYYKTGLVFLAYLNGHQNHFRMIGGLESGRSLLHLSRLVVLADQAGMIRDPELAAQRLRCFLALNGID